MQYDCSTNILIRIADLPAAKHSASLIISNDFAYCVGGSNNSVEKFDLKLLKWTKLSSLGDDRLRPVLWVHNYYLYAFFGIKNGNYIDTIERLNIKNIKAKWENVPYKTDKDFKNNLKMIGCAIVPSGINEIYMVGGKTKDSLKKNAVSYDFSNFIFKSINIELPDETYFQESSLIELSDSQFGQFTMDKSENFLKIQIQ